jgi:hypothetical protein
MHLTLPTAPDPGFFKPKGDQFHRALQDRTQMARIYSA